MGLIFLLVLLCLPLGLLGFIAWAGSKVTPVPREGKGMTRWEHGSLFFAFLASMGAMPLINASGYGVFVVLPFFGICISILAVTIARTERPFLIAALSEVVFLITGLQYVGSKIGPWQDIVGPFMILSGFLFLGTALFTLPFQASREKPAPWT